MNEPLQTPLIMATIGDSTDPKGTRRPNEDPILVSAHTFKPVIVAERPSKICLPSNIRPNDAYGIFSLIFTNDVLAMIAENTNNYGALRHQHLKASWKDTSVTELRAYLGVLIYRSLYPQPRRKGYWTTDINKPIYESLASSIGCKRLEQLEASLHVSDPNLDGDCFSKVKSMSDV